MSRITLAREYPDDRDVIAQICKLKSRTSATEKETSQIEQHLNETDGRVTQLEEVTAGLDPGDIQTVKEVADTVQLHTTQIATLDGETEELVQDVETLQQDVTALEQGKQPVGNYVTTDTEQTITAPKKLTANAVLESSGNADKSFKLRTTSEAIPPFIDAENPTHRMRQYMRSGGAYAFQAYTNNVVDGEPIIISKDRVQISVPNDTDSLVAVNKGWVWQTAANADNGLVHRTANEEISGIKVFKDPIRVENSRNLTEIYNEKPEGATSFVINSGNAIHPANSIILLLDSQDSTGNVRIRVLKKLTSSTGETTYTTFFIPLSTTGQWY